MATNPPRKRKIKKKDRDNTTEIDVRNRQNKFTKEEKRTMLFWWVFYNENSNRAAQEISVKFNRNISRKTIWQMAIRENWRAKAPFVKTAVDAFRKKYSDEDIKSPEQIQLTEMGINMLEIDWQLVKQAKDFIAGKSRTNTPFKSVKECVDALKFVQENVTAMIGDSQLRRNAWDHTKQIEGGEIYDSAEIIMNELNVSERQELVNKIEDRIASGKIAPE